MKKAGLVMIAAVMLTAPAQAADWNDMRTGTFVGARLTIGGRSGARPVAALTAAPTQSLTSNNGQTSIRFGEGIALNLSPGTKPTLTLAGVRADTALGLRPQDQVDGNERLGLSKGGKIAIGVAVALAAAAGTAYVVLSNRCTECDQ